MFFTSMYTINARLRLIVTYVVITMTTYVFQMRRKTERQTARLLLARK